MANSVFLYPGPVAFSNVSFADGTKALPGIPFTSEPSSGWYRAGAGDIRLSVLNTDRISVGSTATVLNGPDAGGYLRVVNGSVQINSASLALANAGSNRVVINATADGVTTFGNNGSTALVTLTLPAATLTATLEVIAKSGRVLAQAAAAAAIATFTPAADGSFEVVGNVLVTTATSHTFTMTCTYTDESNVARTVTMNFVLVAGGTLTTSIVNTNGAVPYMGVPIRIRAKSGTAITLQTTGTFTTVAYNAEAFIKQVA